MPISIQLSSGLLTERGEREVFSRVSSALLDVHGLSGNPFMTPNVVGHVTIFPEGASYAGGEPQSLSCSRPRASPPLALPRAPPPLAPAPALPRPLAPRFCNLTKALADKRKLGCSGGSFRRTAAVGDDPGDLNGSHPGL